MLNKTAWQRLSLFLVLVFSLDILYFSLTPVISKQGQPVVYSLEPGTPVWKVAFQLADHQLLSRPVYWMLVAELQRKAHHLKAGDYRINPGERPFQLLEQIVAGKVILYSMTVPEGWTFFQMKAMLERQPYLKHALSGLSPADIMVKVGESGRHPEGRFFPDTYLFGRWTPEELIFVKAHQTMQERLAKAWENRAPEVPYSSADEALIVASLIEKEAAKHEERPIIAGVIINRLQKNMLLQIDASVIYGLGQQYQGKLRKTDLKLDTPYNTYLHKGLPPTPICLPGLDAIEAALHPQKTDALFYVSRGDGTHQFSTTLAQHNAAVNKFIKLKHNE